MTALPQPYFDTHQSTASSYESNGTPNEAENLNKPDFPSFVVLRLDEGTRSLSQPGYVGEAGFNNTKSINVNIIGAVLVYLEKKNILIPEPFEVTEYLYEYQEITNLIITLAESAADRFGKNSQISLELFRDPESDDKYLTIYIRQRSYADNIIDLIDEINESIESRLTSVPGWIMVDTDFQPPV